MNPLSRLTERLLVTALALGAMAWFAEPLPADTATPMAVVVTELPEDADKVALELKREAAALRRQVAAARHAAQMRWFLTLPAAGKRCGSSGCAG